MDFSDRELLALVGDFEGQEGWVSSETIAKAIWPRAENDEDYLFKTKQSVAQRFAWLRRYGAMERDEKEGLWRMTDTGRELVTGRLGKARESAIVDAEEYQLLALGMAFGERYLNAEGTAAILLRRAWQFAYERKRGRY